jgi:flagellin
MVSAINSAAMSQQVLQLLGISGKGLRNSLSALSSGNRLVQASTDISAMSIATGMQSQINGMRTALMNVSQASSFLEVADGGLQQAQLIVDRMSALSVQANSGALSDSARRGLNTEFQNLRQELDRLAGNTNFNGVNLLDGTLSRTTSLQASDASGGQAASGSLNFLSNVSAGQTIVLNGVTLTAGTDFTVGSNAQQTVSNLAAALNDDSRFDGFRFAANNASLSIEAEAAGRAGNQFTINQAGSTASFFTSGDELLGTGVFSLSGGTDAGLSLGDTRAVGSVGDTILSANNGQAARVDARFNTAADIQAGNTLQIDDGQGGFTTFTFVNGAPATSTQIQIGTNLEDTLSNAARTINNFSGPGDFGVRQLNVTTDGRSLTFTGRQLGNATDVNGTPLDINLTTAGGSLSATQFSNGSSGGVNLNGVVNNAFVGRIQGFQAIASGTDQADVSLSVGGITYRAQISDTTPAADTTIRFTSDGGGSFELTLRGGQGEAVNGQADAARFADRLNAAFSTLNVTQTRDLSLEGSGALIGASLRLTGSSFAPIRLQDVNVTSNLRGNAQLEVVINGETYRVNSLGNTIGINEQLTLTSTRDANRTLQFTNGSTRFDLSSDAGAASLQAALERNLGLPGGEGARFQVGNNAQDQVNLTIGDISSATLFNGRDLNLLSADAAAEALSSVRSAQDYLTTQRAGVGAYAQALNYTGAQLETAIMNQDAARAVLADTDIASESTVYAQLLLQRQAQIATLAQGNRLQGNILQLLGN